MADDSGQDKTETATGKRVTDSRKKGQIARSKELNVFVTLIVSSALFVFMGQHMTNDLRDMMMHQFILPREVIFDPLTPLNYLKRAFTEGFLVIVPFILVLLIVDLLTPLLMGGWNFSSEGFEPKFEKLNPLTGIKRILGIQGFIELIKAIIKTLLVGFMTWSLFNVYFDDFMGLSHMPIDQGIYRAAQILVDCLLILSSTFLLLVMIDVPYQLWHLQDQLKMTKQEVRDENKEMEGNPEVKGKIRRMQMEASRRRMMEAVPNADVIVTNPTHFAVALKYDLTSTGAPLVVAKGTDLIAAQIRNVGMAANVTLVAVPALSRALYYSTDLNEEIPRGLFLAVAQVLAYVFQLRAANQNGWSKPVPPSDVPVPDEFRQ
ncbi:flagellar biosynthesis protein FlhB [Methylomonas sp. AM2-LC]|uniref:flagellar biosynthesis protein FlhB n=1 Tax=Methylomonas sp. AM2-LC TaxID=3153301 RepID=UPI0032675AB2